MLTIARFIFACLVVLLAAMFEPSEAMQEIALELQDMGWFGDE